MLDTKGNCLPSALCPLPSVIRLPLDQPLDEACRHAVVAVGNFDGCHLGHQHIFQTAKTLAGGKKKVGVLTFEPHPKVFFRPAAVPFRLTNLRTKIRRFGLSGVDIVYVAHFTKMFVNLTAQAFIDQILVNVMGVDHVIVGQDFAFGYRRQGNVQFLQEQAKSSLMGVTTITPVVDDQGNVISSTRIRHLLQEGQIEQANRLLGWTWEIEGVVRQGEGRGKELGWPTLNIDLGQVLHPHPGIYVALVGLCDKNTWTWYPGIAYSGDKPTFSGLQNNFEAHIFDMDQDLYHQRVRVKLLKFLRPDQSFDTVDALVKQMKEDDNQARAFFTQVPYQSFLDNRL